MLFILNLDALMENKICCYEYVPVLNGKRELGASLEYKEAKKPYRAIPSVQVLKRLCAPTLVVFFLLSIMFL